MRLYNYAAAWARGSGYAGPIPAWDGHIYTKAVDNVVEHYITQLMPRPQSPTTFAAQCLAKPTANERPNTPTRSAPIPRLPSEDGSGLQPPPQPQQGAALLEWGSDDSPSLGPGPCLDTTSPTASGPRRIGSPADWPSSSCVRPHLPPCQPQASSPAPAAASPPSRAAPSCTPATPPLGDPSNANGSPLAKALLRAKKSMRLKSKPLSLLPNVEIVRTGTVEQVHASAARAPGTQAPARKLERYRATIATQQPDGTLERQHVDLARKVLQTPVRESDGAQAIYHAILRVSGELRGYLAVLDRAAEAGCGPASVLQPILFWDVEPGEGGRLALVLYTRWAVGGSLSQFLCDAAAGRASVFGAAIRGASPDPGFLLPCGVDGVPPMDWRRAVQALVAYVHLLQRLEALGIIVGDGKFANVVIDGPGLTARLIDSDGTGVLPEAPCAGGKTGAALAAAVRGARLAPLPCTVSTDPVAPVEARVGWVAPTNQDWAGWHAATEASKAKLAAAEQRLAAAQGFHAAARVRLQVFHRLGNPLAARLAQDLPAMEAAVAEAEAAVEVVKAEAVELALAAEPAMKRMRERCAACPAAETLLLSPTDLDEATWAELMSFCPGGVVESWVCLASHVWQLGVCLEAALVDIRAILLVRIKRSGRTGTGTGLGEENERMLKALAEVAEACKVQRPSARPSLEEVLAKLAPLCK
ncbi:hypothetical protein HYH03_009716 [Edaphochlamys debaryana]|uniref:Uncharacterized protein n=1 Tax=Edaphochlamys debaryana TaxID=47281 RepID=A0A835XY04_9CHLO|nr:hypothetical protein HYH03_009716 [Edaphochlamys debaryana]|eukprot:KAG2491985.1 hypothetical protein HYH03_009716 [Edaphochlamys debaryana]